MSLLLIRLLQATRPDYWDETDYQDVRLKKFSLSMNSDEYMKILDEFVTKFGSNSKITEITRIQHPYAYASCQIRRKQLAVIKNCRRVPEEGRIYFRFDNVNQIDEFLEYNCDKRKAGCLDGYGLLSGSGCVVMAKEIVGLSNTRSSNIYPDYLIKYIPRESVNNPGMDESDQVLIAQSSDLTSNTVPLTSDTGPLTSDTGPLTSDTGPLISDTGSLTSDTGPLTSPEEPSL